ncbi:S1 family peptidase [Streptomyces kronopolitis]|uniref:S1 family peptidase n=1 Tax=Streptomyces kronopolitis TaxID=1612435 RepID=UPI0036796D3C
MFGKKSRSAWLTGVLTTGVAAGMLTAAPAHAVVGPAAKGGDYTFTAQLDIGGQRSCTGALVDPRWVITAARCFADRPDQSTKVEPGAPKLQTVATIGRTDMSGEEGQTADIVELVPRADRDVVMARLAKPVTGITPVTVAAKAAAQGETLRVTGYGRTEDEWAPERLHSAEFTVKAADTTSLKIDGADPANAAICAGDTGGPAFRTVSGRPELVALNSTSWQAGCFGADAAETRRDATSTRVDDIAAWVQQVRYRPVFAAAPWEKATHIASGYFTGGSAGGTRHMDMIVRWNDAEVTLYQGSDDKDPRHPFSAEYQLAEPPKPPKTSIWQHAKQITGASFGGGTDGLIVRWGDGELTQYTHVDAKGFHGEKMLAKAKNTLWPHAQQITAGRYSANQQRDDLLVTWDDGRVTLHPDLDTNGVADKAQKVLVNKNTTWPHATHISAGEFTGKKTMDLLVRWSDGEATLYPGVDTAGFHGETNVRPRKSYWTNTNAMAGGAYAANDRANDVIIPWANGSVSLYPGVDASGTHEEIKIVN